MKRSISFASLMLLSISLGCSPDNKRETIIKKDSLIHENAKIQDLPAPSPIGRETVDSTAIVVEKIRVHLRALIEEDDKLGIVDTLSKQFKYFEIDLNADGSNEIFVGLTGPYFCGSGGCNILLLDADAKIITKFSVSDIPVVVSKNTTNHWRDLYIRTNGAYHLMKFNGTKYPSNPSILPKIDVIQEGDVYERVFDIENNQFQTFNF